MKLERTYVSLKVLGDRFVSINAFGILRGRYVLARPKNIRTPNRICTRYLM